MSNTKRLLTRKETEKARTICILAAIVCFVLAVFNYMTIHQAGAALTGNDAIGVWSKVGAASAAGLLFVFKIVRYQRILTGKITGQLRDEQN